MSEKVTNSNYMDYMANPKGFTLKRWFAELLGADFVTNSDIVERIAVSLTTQQDLDNFGKLIAAVYEKGFHKAFNEYKKEAEKMGLILKIIHPDQKP